MCKNSVFVYAVLLVIAEEFFLRTTASSLISTDIDLCGSESEIELTKSGDTSAMTVTLSPLQSNTVCKLRVKAPKTHAINMQFVEASPEILTALMLNQTGTHPPCVMSIFLPENPKVPVWKGDPCADSPLKHDDLLTSDFKIIWNPPANPSFTRGRKFVLTAVGQGQVCKEPGQHTCMRIGWDPMMCVSDTLLCNGFVNCPKSSTTSDEDDKFCKKRFFAPASLEQLAVELFKKWRPPELENKWNHEKSEESGLSSSPLPLSNKIFFNWRDWQEIKTTETTTTSSTTAKPLKKPPKATDSISQVLSKYGPWGYLMLGMLICGTVLMFCGLWECCFRKPKTDIEAPISQTPPTTVLVINPQQEATPNPPNYDELDQPPSYTTLFPNFKVTSESSDQTTNSCGESAQGSVNET